MFPIEPSLHEYKFVPLKAFLPRYTNALAFSTSSCAIECFSLKNICEKSSHLQANIYNT